MPHSVQGKVIKSTIKCFGGESLQCNIQCFNSPSLCLNFPNLKDMETCEFWTWYNQDNPDIQVGVVDLLQFISAFDVLC